MTDETEFKRENRFLVLKRADISLDEFNREMRHLQMDYRDSMRESAEQAYQDEVERWQ